MTDHERKRISLASKGLDKLFHWIDVKLSENADKPLWTEQEKDHLLECLEIELEELVASVTEGEAQKAVWREAADVAVLAMMPAQRHEAERNE